MHIDNQQKQVFICEVSEGNSIPERICLLALHMSRASHYHIAILGSH